MYICSVVNFKNVIQLAILIAVMNVISLGNVHAATYYVSTAGADTNPGTLSQPFRTIKRGWAAMASGDTLYVRGGTYEEMLYHNYQGFAFKSGTSTAYSTMRNYNGEIVTIRPPKSTSAYRVVDFNGGVHHIEIDGFILDGVNVLYDAVKINKGQASYIRIKNSEIKNAPENGILGGDAGCEIINNDIHHNGKNRLLHNIYWGGKNSVIRGNHIHHSTGYGITLFAGSYGGSNQGVDDNLIEANLVHDNGQASTEPQYTSGIHVSSGLRNKVVNNVVYSEYNCINVQYGGDFAAILNNTVYDCRYNYGISVYDPNVTVTNNIALGAAQQNIYSSRTDTKLAANVASGTPGSIFADHVNANFRLKEGSPAIGAGLALADVTWDFDGKLRPVPPSSGAFEYSLGGSATTVASLGVDSTYSGYSSAPIDDGVVNASGGTLTTWASAESTTSPHWVTINFPSATQLNSAAIFWAFNTAQQKYMTSQKVEVQYWDGSVFRTVATIQPSSFDVASSSVSFSPVITSQLRFHQPANQGPPTYPSIMWLTEVDYGFNGTTSSTLPAPSNVSVK